MPDVVMKLYAVLTKLRESEAARTAAALAFSKKLNCPLRHSDRPPNRLRRPSTAIIPL